MKSPTRQLPEFISAGVSATMPTERPLTSTPSTSPESMWNTRKTSQRSLSAGAVRPEVVHGQTMSQLQFSK